MTFPFVSRERLVELRSERDARIQQLEAQLTEAQRDHKRLLDLIFQKNFGAQIYGMLPETTSVEEPETNESDIERAEREFKEQHEAEVARIKSLMRTSPSKVGPALAQIREREQAQKLRPAIIQK